MSISPYELHPERLSTTDATGRRIFLFPADVHGFFRKRRTIVQNILMFIFLVLPWIKIDGRQALLLDVASTRFEIFGLSLRAHNAPLLIFVLAAAAFALFFATALFGRVWCGWACPQTVFIDGIFRRIERLIEGPALERRRLHQSKMNPNKLLKLSAKWSLYILATLVLTHSFLAYFVGTERLAEMMMQSPLKNWGSFLFMGITSAVILFDFAWFREQFCTLVCPYGRFQSVLMDKSSLVVAYDVARGEPRSTPQAKVIAKTHNGKLGDCVNCYRCVQVCPTGIDIRRGTQMECIACTACIDACDEVMVKIQKPTGLIRYSSAAKLMKQENRAPLKTSVVSKFNFRAGLYLGLCVLSVGALMVSLMLIKPVDVEVLRAQDTPYTSQADEAGKIFIVNHFKLELSNQSGSDHELLFTTTDEFADHDFQLITAVHPLAIADGTVKQTDLFIRFPKMLLLNGVRNLKMIIRNRNIKTNHVTDIEKEVTLVGPFS